MKYEDRVVIHEGKEYKALKIIHDLGLCEWTYYNQRQKGKSAQEAFLHCLRVKENKKTNPNIKEIAKENEISPTTIYKFRGRGMELDEIVKVQEEKKEKQFQTLEYLRKIGLPLEYNSLTDFCNREQLNMIRIYIGIQKGMNLYDAVAKSLIVNTSNIGKSYYGLQLKSFAQKYGLDPNQINFWIRKGYSYLDAIEREIFARIFSTFFNNTKRCAYLWKIYKNNFLQGINIQVLILF